MIIFRNNFKEIDFLWEILNCKIVNKASIQKRNDWNKKTHFYYKMKKIEKLLSKITDYKLIEDKEHIIFPYKLDIKYFKFHNENHNVRRKIIEMLILINGKDFSLYKINFMLGYENEERNVVSNDLKIALKKLGLNYKLYIEEQDKKEYIRKNIKDFLKKREEIIQEIIVNRLDRVYRKEAVYFEITIIEIMSEVLNINNIEKIYKVYLDFLEKYPIFHSKREIYNFFIDIIINIYNFNINQVKFIRNKNVFKTKEYKIISKLMNDIGIVENTNITEYFKYYLYRKIYKKFKDLKPNHNIETEYFVLKENIEYIIEEKQIKYNEFDLTEKIVKKSKIEEEYKKIKTLLLIDVELKYVSRILKKYEYLISKLDITKIIKLNDFHNIINGDNEEWEQVLIISDIEIRNIIRNNGSKPIYIIVDKNLYKNTKQNKMEALKDSISLYSDMKKYKTVKK